MSLLRSPWVSGGLAVAALGFVVYQVLSSGRPHARSVQVASAAPSPSAPQPIPAALPKAAPPPSESSTQTVTSGPTPVDRQFVQSHVGEWIESPKRDPFLDATAAKLIPAAPSPVPTWKLSGIWNQTGSRLATINGSIYQEGDEIEGYRIERIEEVQVWFRGPTGTEPLGFTNRPAGTNALPRGTNAVSGAQPPARSDFRPESTNRPYRKLPLIEE